MGLEEVVWPQAARGQKDQVFDDVAVRFYPRSYLNGPTKIYL
jgi:hypothetical protein